MRIAAFPLIYTSLHARLSRFVVIVLSMALPAALSACSSVPFTLVKGRAWASPEAPRPTSIELARPDVDRQTFAASIEAELSRLAPLVFMTHELPLATGADMPPAGAEAIPCKAEISAVEREYTAGWKTRRSTVLEIVVRRMPDAGEGQPEFIAASRAQAQGSLSLSSSRDLHRLLDKAVRKLANKLEEAK